MSGLWFLANREKDEQGAGVCSALKAMGNRYQEIVDSLNQIASRDAAVKKTLPPQPKRYSKAWKRRQVEDLKRNLADPQPIPFTPLAGGGEAAARRGDWRDDR